MSESFSVTETDSKSDKVTNILELDGVKYSHVVIERVTDILSRKTGWLDDICIDIHMRCLKMKHTSKIDNELENIFVGP